MSRISGTGEVPAGENRGCFHWIFYALGSILVAGGAAFFLLGKGCDMVGH